jgi:hypothetical protein
MYARPARDECSSWLVSVFFMFSRNMSTRCGEASHHVLLSLAKTRCKPGARPTRLSGQNFVIWLIKWDVYHVWTAILWYMMIYVIVIWALNCEMINYDDYVC